MCCDNIYQFQCGLRFVQCCDDFDIQTLLLGSQTVEWNTTKNDTHTKYDRPGESYVIATSYYNNATFYRNVHCNKKRKGCFPFILFLHVRTRT